MASSHVVFTVDGESLFPTKVKFKYDREPIWSSNTRRNSSAKMTGKIVGWKKKLEVIYTPKLTQANVKKIIQTVGNNVEWHTVSYTNDCGEVESNVKMYIGNISTEPYYFNPDTGEMMYTSLSFSLIEQ